MGAYEYGVVGEVVLSLAAKTGARERAGYGNCVTKVTVHIEVS